MPGKTYLVDRKTKEKYCVSGLQPCGSMPQKENLQKKFSSHRTLSSNQLPPRVDLPPEMTPIEDQSQTGSW
jgi:hypothetical protein